MDATHLNGIDVARVVRIERGAVYMYDEASGVSAPRSGEGLKTRQRQDPAALHFKEGHGGIQKEVRGQGGAADQANGRRVVGVQQRHGHVALRDRYVM